MIELFKDIPVETKQLAAAAFDLAMAQKTILGKLQMLENYYQSCKTEEEKDFVNFYFNFTFVREYLTNITDISKISIFFIIIYSIFR